MYENVGIRLSGGGSKTSGLRDSVQPCLLAPSQDKTRGRHYRRQSIVSKRGRKVAISFGGASHWRWLMKERARQEGAQCARRRIRASPLPIAPSFPPLPPTIPLRNSCYLEIAHWAVPDGAQDPMSMANTAALRFVSPCLGPISYTFGLRVGWTGCASSVTKTSQMQESIERKENARVRSAPARSYWGHGILLPAGGVEFSA